MIHTRFPKITLLVLLLIVTSVTFHFFPIKASAEINIKYPNSGKSIGILPENDLQITKERLESNGIVVTTNLRNLTNNEKHEFALVFLHPTLIKQANREDLNKLYQDGIILVALDTSVAELIHIIDAQDVMAEGYRDSTYTKDNNQFLITMIHLAENPLLGSRGDYVYSEVINPKDLFIITLGYLEMSLSERQDRNKENNSSSCTPNPTIPGGLKVGTKNTATGYMTAFDWTTDHNQTYSNYQIHADTFHSTNAFYIKARPELWTNCSDNAQDDVHKIGENNNGFSYYVSNVCDIQYTTHISATACSNSNPRWWGNTFNMVRVNNTSSDVIKLYGARLHP